MYLPPCASYSSFADTVRVYKLYLLTYLLTYKLVSGISLCSLHPCDSSECSRRKRRDWWTYSLHAVNVFADPVTQCVLVVCWIMCCVVLLCSRVKKATRQDKTTRLVQTSRTADGLLMPPILWPKRPPGLTLLQTDPSLLRLALDYLTSNQWRHQNFAPGGGARARGARVPKFVVTKSSRSESHLAL